MKAYVFPGQGSQFPGMGKDLYEKSDVAKELFRQANEVLGFDITNLMFEGTAEQLLQTKVTQPCIFIHSVISVLTDPDNFNPDAVAGHSLGEFSALTAAGALTFADGLSLVAKRASAMQECCETHKGSMAAVLGLDDDVIEQVCAQTTQEGDVVVAANYNCIGQIVISGSEQGVDKASQKLEEAGAKRVVKLAVSGAFHSPLMQPAQQKLQQAIDSTVFTAPKCPVYQNVDAMPHTDPEEIKQNLIKQLTSPVRWTKTIQNMAAAGIDEVIECGPGSVLQGLMRKIDRNVKSSHFGA
ncbi:MAG: ACP S-malonyltransferase [Bacteroidales bacterium]|nr:ACP S-malonyltransferase [Bacteroidales bacterium]